MICLLTKHVVAGSALLLLRAFTTQRTSSAFLQGNVDPMVLFGSEAVIRQTVAQTLAAAGGRRHILNVGHGVVQVCGTSCNVVEPHPHKCSQSAALPLAGACRCCVVRVPA